MLTMLDDTYWVPCHIEVASDGVFLHTFDGDFIIQVKGDQSRIIREGKHKLAYIRHNNSNLEVYLLPLTEESQVLTAEYWACLTSTFGC